ncbi:glycosyltransferase [Clostridium bovifaecis]|uniref:Glycosyltransferase n=1 Tax=Clostridium bovifaecis TaxID=2184719 RepID=A0A6I6FCL3_9CLOT|nr:glycosyltransferase [Clostridium bovifaecis]
MRILMLSWEYPPNNVGGLSNHVYYLAHGLHKMGHEVYVITCQDGTAPIKENDEGVLVYRVEPYKIETEDFIKWAMQLNFAMIEESIRLIKSQGKIDIIHAHDWLSAYCAKTLKWAYNIPVVCTIHATEYGRNGGIKTDMQRYISSVEWNLTYEAWKVVALEAMAAGCPVVASDVGGFSEIIHNRTNGLKFLCGSTNSLKDKVLEVLNDFQLSSRLVENGLKVVKEKYSWQQVSELTAKMYSGVLEEAKGTEWESCG